VSKYSADIEIAVRGGQQINAAIKSLNRLNNSINVVTRNAKLLEGKGFNVASMENYSRAVSKAERALRKAAEGTDLERQAVSRLVTAMDAENKARERKNILIAREIANQRRVVATANAGVGVQGPAIPAFMRTGPSSPIRGSRTIPGSPAALAAGASAGRPSGGGGSRLGGAISGSIIGGSFPLLFGQGAGAATGGAVGGLVGGLAGPGGSFAGSLLGTLLGDIASKGKGIQDLADDMGLAAEQTKQLAAAFQEAGRDADKFGAAVQTVRGIGFADDEQVEVIKLVSKLTDDYGGKIDKIAAAYGNFAAKGKVGIADINKFTAQGIPILDQLEKKYGKNRDEILALAKAGEITAQDLSDALVEIANRSDEVAKRTTSSFERTFDNLKKGAGTSVSAIAIILGNLVGVSTNVTDNIFEAFSSLYVNLVNGAVEAAARISDALASAANNIAAFYKANPLVIPALRDAAVSGLESFKAGAQGTSKQLRELTKQPTGISQIRGPQIPGQLPPSGDGGAAADKAAKDAARERKRVAELVRSQGLVTAEVKRQAELSAKIFAAELAKDPMLARRLKGEQQLVEWGYETANLLEKEESIQGQLAIARAQQAKQALILQKTTQDLVKLENDRVESANKDIAALENELKIKNALTQAERDRLRIEYEMQVLGDSKQYDTGQLAVIENLKKQIAAPTLGADLIRQQIGTLSDEILKLTDGGNIAITVANGIGSAFSTSFKGIIDGSMSAKEALASFFTSVADMFLDMAAQIIAKMITMAILNQILGVLPGIGGAGSGTLALSSNPNVGAYMGGGGIEGITMGTFGGFKANGGPVSSGQTYMVGERGPELFVPGRSGTIVANDKMGGGSTNVVVNVDAKGSSVEGNEQGANQLGRVISAAVQSELIKQQRPGGILAR
jgi:tape measure domain-containing protein